MLKSLQSWWQSRTGVDDSPFDGESAAFAISLVVHLVLLVTLGLIPLWLDRDDIQLTLTSLNEEPETLQIAEEFYHAEEPTIDLGANSEQGVQAAESQAATVSDILDVPNPADMEPQKVGEIIINNVVAKATGKKFNENLAVRGHVGADTKGAEGAIDRITHEILLSLEERKTLVVWIFDQSGSLNRRRKEINERFGRIYEELGLIEAAGNENFKKYQQPLLSSIWAFGAKVEQMTEKETANVNELKEAVDSIQQDNSGVENVFTSVYQAASRFEKYRRTAKSARRNVMLIVVTDEVGDDQNGLDSTVKLCRRLEMPVYVVGVPAPFGRRETRVKWVDPDPKYDQSPQWGRVNQGPESLLPERIKLHFAGQREDEAPLDSGFGPFALTRLCYETGGIYFAIHPNRNVNRAVSGRETDAFAAHIKHFFDPAVMRRYQPDYVSAKEYMRRAEKSQLRSALLNAAQVSWVTQMDQPRQTFIKRDEASFNNELSQAQEQAALLEPRVQRLFEVLSQGEQGRDLEASPRWLAGYDLAMGRLLAVKVRTESYNAMLAAAKRGMKFKTAKNNTWTLRPSDKVTAGSKLANQAKASREYLNRVATEHAGTPWALLAQRELKTPVSWEWVESFTDLNPPQRNRANNNNNNNPPRPGVNDRPMMLKRPPPKRPPPKL